MKIENPRTQFLSNYEVLQHINELAQSYNWNFSAKPGQKLDRKKKYKWDVPELESLAKDLTSYLDKSPAKHQNVAKVSQFMSFLNDYELVKIEKLQILNSCPTSMVHLYALVEECDQRFSEDQCEAIINKVIELFPEITEADEATEEPEDPVANVTNDGDIEMEE